MLIEHSGSAQLAGHHKFQPGPVFLDGNEYYSSMIIFPSSKKSIKPNFIPHKPCQANWVSAHMELCIYWCLICSRSDQTRKLDVPQSVNTEARWEHLFQTPMSFVLNLRREGEERLVFALSLEVEGTWPQFRKSAAMAKVNANEAAPARTSRWVVHLSSAGTCTHTRKAHRCTSGREKEPKCFFLRAGKSADHQAGTSLLRLLR